MNILIVEGRNTIGGGQVVTRRIVKALSNDYEVTILMPGSEESQLSYYLKEFNKLYYFQKEYNRGKKSLKDFFIFIVNFIFSLYGLIKAFKGNDLIYVQHLNSLPQVIFLNCFFQKKIIVHVHVYYISHFVRILINKLLHSKYVVKIIGVSNYALSQLDDKNLSKSKVCYNCVDLVGYKKKINQDRNIAIVGDIIPSKGQETLLKALCKLKQKFTVYFVGNIMDFDYKEKLLSYSNTTNIIFTGLLNNVIEFLNANINLIIIPSNSKFETFSLSMVESWSLGIPTIATNDFGMKEIVCNNLPSIKNYLLFDTIDDLADKIEKLFSDASIYKIISDQVYKVQTEKMSPTRFDAEIINIVSNI